MSIVCKACRIPKPAINRLQEARFMAQTSPGRYGQPDNAPEVRVGISGWTYPGWRGDFYPKGLVQRRELEYASHQLNSIEINGSFYSLQRPTSYATWSRQTPDGFRFTVKGGRFITHLRRLANAETPLANFFASGVLGLGPKLGPILWQLPPNFAYDRDRLTEFFTLLPRTTTAAAKLAGRHDDKIADDQAMTTTDADRPLRYALEVRHDSFQDQLSNVVALLREHDVALVVADAACRWPLIEQVTSSLVYLRLHGADELYASGYTSDGLDSWAAKIQSWLSDGLDAFVYFDNDMKVGAPYDAQALATRLDISWPPQHDPSLT